MVRPQVSLAGLPVEVLHAIFLQLPSGAALTFVRTCRRIYAACDDPNIWRNLIASQSTLAAAYHDTKLRSLTEQSGWKRYAVADAVATSQHRALERKDVEEWLPHLIALEHPIITSVSVLSLSRLCDAICSVPIVSGRDVATEDQADSPFAFAPDRAEDTQTWRLAQAAGFCVSAHLLASPPDTEKPPNLLQSAQWFRVTDHRGLDVGTSDTVHHLVMLHALANRALGLFYRELCWTLVNGSMVNVGADPAMLVRPPTTRSLSLATLCAPPVPFAADSLGRFGTCHLPTMTTPAFFIDDEWTGYSCCPHRYESKLIFSAMGGDGVDHFDLPSQVGQTMRFRLVREWDNGTKYLLHSNYFQMHAAIQALQVTVDRSTGHLKIAHNRPPLASWHVCDAVMTPFGIVEGLHPNKFWTWFWKCKWSETNI